MKIFTPIVASLVLACVATQGDLIAQNRRESDQRQQIRRIVREELKRALAEIHESRDRAAAKKKVVATKKVQATKLRVQRGAKRKQAAARAQPRKTQPLKVVTRQTAPQRRLSPNDALNRAHKALQNARRALAEAEQALNQARRAGPRPTTVRTVRRSKDGTYGVETKTVPRAYRTNVKIKGQPLRVVTSKIKRPLIRMPRIEVPHFEVRMVRPTQKVGGYVFEFGEAKPHQVKLAPITEVKRTKKKSQKKKDQKKKKKKARKAKKRTGRIV